MNVMLKDEEPSGDLLRMTFLSKGWRHPTTADAIGLSKLGIKVPRFVVLHDTKKLIGKAYAPAKGRKSDRAYRIKRLCSYMELCAHQPDVYEKLADDVKRFETMPDGSKMKHNIKVPSYDAVLTNWYKPDIRVLEEDEPIPEDEKGEFIDYSMDGLADTICNIVSVIPDVLNPIIYNIGYTTYLTSLFGVAVSWPVELLRRSNTMLTTAGLTQLMKRTCYDFLADNPRLVTVQNDEPDDALLTRHWVYMLLMPNARKAFSFFVWAGYLDKKLAELNFIINGYVQPYIKRVDVPFLEIFLVALLSCLPGLPIPAFVRYVRIPAFSNVVEMVYSYILNNVWGKVPANMKQTAAAIEQLGPECPAVLVEAPTGTGKSTTFINYLYRYYGHRYTRVVVVVPRTLLVTTLAPYLAKAFSLPVCPVTTGHAFDPGKRLILTTPQEVLLHERWLTEGNLFVVDEAHVDEAPVRAVIHILKTMLVPTIYTTATPTGWLKENAGVHVPLQLAMTWTITEDFRPKVSMPEASYHQWWGRYRSDVLGLVRSRNLSKFLIFVVDQKHALDLAQSIGKRVCVLTSRDREIDEKADVFIASAVADVGLTLPNVDWVITSNVTRCQLPGHNDEVVALVSLPFETVRQRRGRTGRTNNGIFTYFQYTDMPFLKRLEEFDHHTTGVALLLSGTDPKIIAKFYPQVVAGLFQEAYTRELDPKIDKFTEALSNFYSVADQLHQRTFKKELDCEAMHNYWTVQGNTIPTTRKGKNEAGKDIGQPLQSEEAARFMIGAAAWLAQCAEDLPPPAHIAYYLRESVVGSVTFKDKIHKIGTYMSWSGDADNVSGPGYGRFGKTSFPPGMKSHDDINEGFTFW
jgi:late competence protein required for DNA uptake (superfamily II DNA/RNA helicase)